MIGTIFSAFVMVVIVFYIWNKWSDTKIKWKSFRSCFYVLITSIITLINYFNSNQFMKFINLTLIFILIYKNLFKVKFKSSIIVPVFSQILYLLSESLFLAFVISVLHVDINTLVNNYFGGFIINISVSFIALCLSRFGLIKKVVSAFGNIVSKIHEVTILFWVVLIMYIYSIFAFNIYYNGKPEFLIIMSIAISISVLILVFLYFKAKDDYYRMNDKYNSSLLSLRELESALTNHRIDNHENKNHLMTIRNMVSNKKAIKFIDSILDNQLKDNNKILKETSIIPSGGLRGLIYSKILLMSSKNIEYELSVASSVRVVDIFDYGDSIMLDICKIVGIFLDNAIEEVEKLEEKYVIIEMYKDSEDLIISITNVFDNSIDKKDIYKAGITTKGKGHGYGLSLVKKIINNNVKLNAHNEITSNEFTQTLKICK